VILGSSAQPAPLMPPDGPMGAIESRPGTLPALAGTPRPGDPAAAPGLSALQVFPVTQDDDVAVIVGEHVRAPAGSHHRMQTAAIADIYAGQAASEAIPAGAGRLPDSAHA
jgi:hypothetical protein